MSRCGIAVQMVQSRKSLEGLRVLLGEDIAKPKDINGIYICVRVCAQKFLKGGYGPRGLADRVVAQTQQLCRISIFSIFAPSFFQILRGFQVILLVVICESLLSRDPLQPRMALGQRIQLSNGLSILSFLYKGTSGSQGLVRLLGCQQVRVQEGCGQDSQN